MPSPRASVVAFTLAAASAIALPGVAVAQQPPPVTGTIALEGTMKTFYTALNRLIVVTIDGAEHAFRFTKGLVVHGPVGPDPFEGLREGTSVVIYYRLDQAGPLAIEIDRLDAGAFAVTEGMVSKVDRPRQQLVIRFDDGRVEQLALTDTAAAAMTDDALEALANARIRVFYTNESGRRVVHYFRRIEKK